MNIDIDLETYGLKEIKFSELADGDEFNIAADFQSVHIHEPEFYRRKLQGIYVVYADGSLMLFDETVADYSVDQTVFIKA